jgi:hypothetical protein
MSLLLSQHKMIDWLTEGVSKHESPVNNQEVKKTREIEDQQLTRENAYDYIGKNERIHYIDDD